MDGLHEVFNRNCLVRESWFLFFFPLNFSTFMNPTVFHNAGILSVRFRSQRFTGLGHDRQLPCLDLTSLVILIGLKMPGKRLKRAEPMAGQRL